MIHFVVLGLVGMVFLGCDCSIRQCRKGVYIEFGVDPVWQDITYSKSCDALDVWLTPKQSDPKGFQCLPRDLSVRNLSAPESCEISLHQPNFIKGRPLIVLYIRKARQMPKGELIQYDIYQKDVKKQTVQIAVDFRDETTVLVTVNGEQVAANPKL